MYAMKKIVLVVSLIVVISTVDGRSPLSPGPSHSKDTTNDEPDSNIGPQEYTETATFIDPYHGPFEMVNPSLVDEDELYEGDMLLTEEQWSALRSRRAVVDVTKRWTEGPDGYPLVPYTFDFVVDQTVVREALTYWMEHTCIKFKKTSRDFVRNQPHLQFQNGNACSSSVGMLNPRQWLDHNYGQTVSLKTPGCNVATAIHEVGHAIGFWHTFNRPDRDDHITILEENIEPDARGSFDPIHESNNYNVPYDLASRMHYGQYHFTSNNKSTMITKDPLNQELIGNRDGITHRDKLLANRMYDCIGKWVTKCNMSSDPCQNDGYTGNDCTCVCPGGTKGSNCEEIVGDYYAHLRNPQSEKITTEKKIKVESTTERGVRFTKEIVPPPCKKAKVTFTSSNLFKERCKYQNLYVKTNYSEEVGQTLCAADLSIGKTLTSDTVIIITMFNNGGYPQRSWEADVTFENITGCSTTNPPGQKFPDPDDCSKDIVCLKLFGGLISFSVSCSDGLYFNPETSLCNSTSCPSLVKCTEVSQLLPDPDCNKYIIFTANKNGTSTETSMPCPAGQYFNPEKNYCDHPENVKSCPRESLNEL